MPAIYGQNEYRDITPAEARLLLAAHLIEEHHEYPQDFRPVPYGDGEPWDDIARIAPERNTCPCPSS